MPSIVSTSCGRRATTCHFNACTVLFCFVFFLAKGGFASNSQTLPTTRLSPVWLSLAQSQWTDDHTDTPTDTCSILSEEALLGPDSGKNLCYNIPQCGSTGCNGNIWTENQFCVCSCTRGQRTPEDWVKHHLQTTVSTNVWKVASGHTIWPQTCFDMHHWALGSSEKFHFEQFVN